MDAVKYIKELNRMCEAKKECSDCYAKGTCNFPDAEKAEEAVAAVERWSREHPVMTNGRKLSDMLGVNLRYITRRTARKPYVEIWIDADWWDAESPEHDGCTNCKWVMKTQEEQPCSGCKQNYLDKWEGRDE